MTRRLGCRRRQLPRPGRCSPTACGRCSPTRARARSSSSSSTTARTTARSTRCATRVPDVRVDRVAGQRRLRARREPRDRRDARAGRRRAQPRPDDGTRHREGDARPASTRSRALGACGPRIRNLDGSDYPSARTFAVGRRSRSAHGLLGLWWPTNPFTARYRQLDADPAQPRSVDWVSGAAIWLRRGALDEVGGWDERYFMYMEDIDLCWRLRHAGLRRRVRAGGRRDPRAGREHVAASVPDARRAPPLGLAIRAAPPHRRGRGAAAVRGACISPLAASWRWPSTPGTRPGRVPAAASLPGVTNASRAKRKRAAVRSAKRSRHNTLVVRPDRDRRHRRRRAHRVHPGDRSPPPVGPFLQDSNGTKKDTHWHAALGVYDCDHWMGDSTGSGVWNWPDHDRRRAPRPGPPTRACTPGSTATTTA